MTMHRISKAVGSAASTRMGQQAVPAMLPGEVGAKISERDRQLREMQRRDAQHRRAHEV